MVPLHFSVHMHSCEHVIALLYSTLTGHHGCVIYCAEMLKIIQILIIASNYFMFHIM